MPRGLRRFQQSGQSHFVTFSWYRRQPNLDSPDACDLFVQCLEDMRSRFAMCIYGYVVMPEHVHLLAKRTGGRSAGRCHSLSQVVFRQTVAQPTTHHPIQFILAKTRLRPEREGRARVSGEVTIPASQSGEARAAQGTSRVEVEQLSSLRPTGNWRRRNRVRMDRHGSGDKNSGQHCPRVP